MEIVSSCFGGNSFGVTLLRNARDIFVWLLMCCVLQFYFILELHSILRLMVLNRFNVFALYFVGIEFKKSLFIILDIALALIFPNVHSIVQCLQFRIINQSFVEIRYQYH